MRQFPHKILFLSPLNFEMPCLAIADNPRNPSCKARCVGIIVSIKLTRDFLRHTDWFWKRKRCTELFNLEMSVIYFPCFSMSFSTVGLSTIRQHAWKLPSTRKVILGGKTETLYFQLGLTVLSFVNKRHEQLNYCQYVWCDRSTFGCNHDNN